jgi:hypothetical protein
MEETITIRRSELIEVFQRWNDAAAEGQWPQKWDAVRSTDAFIEFVAQVQNPQNPQPE